MTKDTKTPEFLQIKGYKYRAKMLIAAAVVLLILLLILNSIINSISAALHKSDDVTSDTDFTSDTEQSYSSDRSESQPSTDISSGTSVTEGSGSELEEQERFDADNKLIINYDTLNGKKAIAITFDDGPGEYTQKLVEELNARGARATFFMVGSCVEQYPEVLPLMVSGGHQLGNHTYNHTDITSISNKEMNDQISKTDNAIYNACGQVSTAFRPPYGACTNDTNRVIDKTITLWSLDTYDWKLDNANDVKDTIVSNCHDGDIILLHDIHKHSVEGAIAAIDELQENGFVFVTVDQLLTRYGYAIKHGESHSSQYAVYETNSPYAAQYQKEIDAKKAEQASSSAAESFYHESSRKENADVDRQFDSQTSSNQITVIQPESNSSKKRLIY